MSRKDDLIRQEQQVWEEFRLLLDRIPADRMEEPGLNAAGWSVKDLLWHLGCWYAEGSRALEQIRLGTFREREYDTDAENARILEAGRRVDLETVNAELTAARNRSLQEFGALQDLTPEAEEWFYEEGPEHVRDHLAELRAFVEKHS